MMKFNKHANVIYADSAEKLAKAVVLYADVDNSNLLCWDADFEFPVMPDELTDLFVKGLVLIKGNSSSIVKPVSVTPAAAGEAPFTTVVYNSTNYISADPADFE